MALTACGGARTAAVGTAPTPRRPSGTRFRLDRPFAVGAHLRMEVAATERTQSTLTLDGAPSGGQQREERAQMSARTEVLEVDPRGEPIHSRFTIERFEFGEPGQEPITIPPNRVLEIARADTAEHARVTIDGEPATDAMRHAVQLLVSLTHGESGIGSDEVFGSREPHNPGDSWPVDADRAAQSLAASSGIRGTYHGTTRFVGAAEVRGVACNSLEMSLDGDLDALPGLPQGITLDRAHLTTRGRVMLPIDEQLPRTQSTLETRLEVEAHGTVHEHAATLHLVHVATRSDVTLVETAVP